jgi:glycosyltransferase involved in cell wall biosynthesis
MVFPKNVSFLRRILWTNDWFGLRAATERERRFEIRAQWGADNATFVVLFVGKFIRKKRPTDVVNALAILTKKRANVLGVFVGSGELENETRALANRLGIAARFEGFRNQTELPRYYAGADVLVLPSDGRETWGLVVNEAMACETPAIVSDDVGCAPDLIDERRTGFTFPLGDFAALSDRLARLSEMKYNGFDFKMPLRERLAAYSVDAAVDGLIGAIHALERTQAR